MKETEQLKKLMEAVDSPQKHPDRNEPWEYNVEPFRRELTAFAKELPDSHYRNWLLQIINDSGVGLMDAVRAFAKELSDSHYRNWLLQIINEFNKEAVMSESNTPTVNIAEKLRSIGVRWRSIAKNSDGNSQVVTMLPNRNIFLIYFTPGERAVGWAVSELKPGQHPNDVFWDGSGTDDIDSAIKRVQTWIQTDGNEVGYEVDDTSDDIETWE